MEVEVKKITDWNRVLNAARMTIHKKALDNEPSDSFKRNILRSEHSPIRCLEFDIILRDVPYFVVMHLVRHTQGITPFVATSREDRTGVKREDRKQTDLVDCMFSVNANALINISKRRLCGQADVETRKVWSAVKSAIELVDPIMAEFMVPMCVYRGGRCTELTCCKYNMTQHCKKAVAEFWGDPISQPKSPVNDSFFETEHE